MDNRISTRTLLATFTALSLLSASAFAGDGHGHGHGRGQGYERTLRHADKNKDGKLQVSELPPPAAERFAAADANHDGVITRDEFVAQKQVLKKEHFAKVDTNHDGKLSAEERTAAREQHAKARFAKMDKNGDGQIAQGEVRAEKWAHLSKADADKNGSVSFAELQAAFAARGQRHGKK